MGFLSTKLGPLSISQLLIVLVVFGGATVGTYYAAGLIDTTSSTAISEDEQLVPARLGDLTNVVSTDGSITFPVVESVEFESQGQVGEVLVVEGDTVTSGQVIARLDAESVAALEKRVADARVKLRDTQEKLDDTRIVDPLALASAEEAVAKSTLAIQKAADDLADIRIVDPLALAKAEEAVAKSTLAVQKATDDLATIRIVDPLALAKAEEAVAKSTLAVQKATDDLATMTAPALADELADAQSAIDTATVSLSNAEGSLALANRDWADRVQAAADEAEAQASAYSEVFVNWLGVTLTGEEPETAPAALLASWGASLDTLFGSGRSVNDLGNALAQPTNDPATRWSEPVVHSWLTFYPGAILPTCDTGGIPAKSVCVERQLDNAWAALKTSKDKQETTAIDSANAIASADGSVAKAQKALDAALEALEDLNEAADPLEIGVQESGLVVAKANLADAEAALTELTAAADPLKIGVEGSGLIVAKANLADAEAALAELSTGADPLKIGVEESGLVVAKANLANAKAALAELSAGADPLDLSVLRANLEVNELALAKAELDLVGAALTAPIAGVVAEIGIEPGDNARGQGNREIMIVDETVVEIDGVVDEIDILSIAVGVQAEVTLTALPGQTLHGTVTEIGTATNQQGVVTFPVSVQLDVPEGLELLEGLSATASIVTSEIRNVLLVPSAAIQGNFIQPFVRVATGSEVEERSVELGAADDFWVVVTAGLVEGEQVAMPAPSSLVNQADFRNTLRQLQGRGSGGGGRGGGGRGGGGGGGGGDGGSGRGGN